MALHAVFLMWSALVLWNYLPGHPFLWNADWLRKAYLPPCPPWDAPFLLERARTALAAAAVTLLFLLTAHAAGRRLAGWLRLARAPEPVTLLLGWGALSLGGLGAGLAGGWFAPVAWAVLLAGGIAGRRAPARWWTAFRAARGWWMAAALPAAYVTFAGALAPETELDAVRYHLGLPAAFIAQHRVFVPERMMFASFPLNASMAFGEVMLAGGQPAAKLLNWSLLWIVALLAHRLAGGGTPGRLAALLWLGVPVVLVHAAMGFAELTATAFLTAALALLRAGAGMSRRTGSAVLAGFALGTTYRAVHGAIPLAILWALAGRPVRFPAAALLPVLPWLCKNWLIAGNPVHPIAAGPLGSLEDETISLGRSVFRMADLLPRDAPPLTGAWHLLGAGDRGGSYPLGPVVAAGLPLVAAGILGAARRPAIYALLFAAVWIVTTPGWGRYLIGALPAGCAAAAAVAAPLLTRGTPLLRSVGLFLLFVLFVCSSLLGGSVIFQRHFPVPHAWGCETGVEYLAGRIAPPPYGAAILNTAGRVVPPGDRLYLWGMVTTAFSPRRAHADYEHSTPLFQSIVRETRDADHIRRRFRQRRWTAFLHDLSGGVSAAASADLLPWTPRMIAGWQAFVRRHLVLAEKIEVEPANVYLQLYTVRPRPDPAARIPRGGTWPHLPGMERLLVPGDIAYDAKEMKRALAVYESVARECPDYAWAWQRIAVVAKELGHAHRAREAASRLRALGGTP